MALAIGFLLRHAIHRLEGFLHQQLVAIQCRMQQGQPLGVSQRNALVKAQRGYLHQQLGLLVLIGQIEVMTQHIFHDKLPVQMVCSRDSTPGHQPVFLATDIDGLRLVVLQRVGIERAGIRIKAHLRISTHIYRTVQARLQELDVQTKLVLVSPSRRIIYIMVELTDVFFLRGQLTVSFGERG